MNSSRNSVRRKEKPGRPKRTVRRMENSTIWCPHSDPGRCSTKTSQRWNTTASVPSSRAQRAAERDPSPNSTSECCLLLVELRHYTRVQQLYLSLDLERISRPCVVLTAKILKDLYSLFWTCKWQCLCWRWQLFVWRFCTSSQKQWAERATNGCWNTPFSQFCLPGDHKPHLFLSAQILLELLSV